MKKLALLLIVVVGLFVVGCTPTETAAQRNRRIAGITDINARMMVEDWDHIWLYERSSSLTEWHPHVGY
jgi:outer membrane lipoprotein-sorting protein